MKTQTSILKIKNIIEKEAPGGDLKPYWLRWRRFPRAEEGKRAQVERGEECRTKVNRA
jgi:hypothetical protein